MRPVTKESIVGAFSSAERTPEIVYYDVVDSTNKQALLFAREHAPVHPVLFVANEQSAGRGRLGRSFFSPEGGIYMTLLVKPPRDADITAITTYAVTAVCRALDSLGIGGAMIKWVNDVYLGEKKLAGILAQGSVDPESGLVTHVAVGIGLNVLMAELPPELEDIATSLEGEGYAADRAKLTAGIAEAYLFSPYGPGSREALEEYRKRSMLVGLDVDVIRLDRTYTARVIGIGDGCELIVEKDNGERERISTGEVSVKRAR